MVPGARFCWDIDEQATVVTPGMPVGGAPEPRGDATTGHIAAPEGFAAGRSVAVGVGVGLAAGGAVGSRPGSLGVNGGSVGGDGSTTGIAAAPGHAAATFGAALLSALAQLYAADVKPFVHQRW
jgi:hypothetical protein